MLASSSSAVAALARRVGPAATALSFHCGTLLASRNASASAAVFARRSLLGAGSRSVAASGNGAGHSSLSTFSFRGYATGTRPLHENLVTVNVPTMGDSITEGTIVEWTVEPGAFVDEGDVVALMETDKVTLDIKADRAGVLVKQCGEVDANVEVGSELYVLDVDGVAGEAVASTAPAAATVDGSAEADTETGGDRNKTVAVEDVAHTAGGESTRVPSIHFLGKEGWAARRNSPTASSPTVKIPKITSAASPTSVTYMEKSPLGFGKPPISDAEIEALISGGAEDAPTVVMNGKTGSYGASTFVGGIITAGPRGVWLAKEKSNG